MKKFNYIIILTLCLAASSSCKKAIETTPVSVITSSSFFKTPDDAAGALRGMYVDFRVQAANDLYWLGEGRSDMLTNGLAGTQGYDKFWNNTLTASSPNADNQLSLWKNLYTPINSANLILKYVPDIIFPSAATKNSILAQAYTMRAFAYFTLVRAWGGVPLRTTPIESYDPASINLPRSSVADVFALIKSDLNAALSLYPDLTYDVSRSTWSKASADALKGDVYLWTAKMQNGGQADLTTALNAVNEAQTSDVALTANYSDIFSYTNKTNNKEVLMAVHFQLNEGVQNYWQTMYISNLSNVSAATLAVVGTQGVGNQGVNTAQIRKEVRDQFTTDDQRRNATFYEIFDLGKPTAVPPVPPQFVTSIVVKGAGMVNAGTRNFYTDVMIYRYADLLLMKAEIKNALGQDPTTEINLVRQRAYGANYSPTHVFVNGSQPANDAAILKERLLELATEGKRWWDLVRFGQAFNMVPSLAGKSSKPGLLLFPIGQTIRSTEPLVTENPDW
jgi:hypothetical protein